MDLKEYIRKKYKNEPKAVILSNFLDDLRDGGLLRLDEENGESKIYLYKNEIRKYIVFKNTDKEKVETVFNRLITVLHKLDNEDIKHFKRLNKELNAIDCIYLAVEYNNPVSLLLDEIYNKYEFDGLNKESREELGIEKFEKISYEVNKNDNMVEIYAIAFDTFKGNTYYKNFPDIEEWNKEFERIKNILEKHNEFYNLFNDDNAINNSFDKLNKHINELFMYDIRRV